MKAVIPKLQCNWSLLPYLWSCYMLTLWALKWQWSWIKPQMWWTFWSFVTTLQNMSWHTWSPIKLQKLLLSFCGKDTSWSFEHWPSSWATKGPTLKATSIREFCELMGIWKVRTSPYNAQTNGQVGWAHQMLMCMIGKLSKDGKADCLSWISMRLAITRHTPHYLMFGCQPCLPIKFYFPMIRGMKKHQHIDHYIHYKVDWQVAKGIPSYLVKNKQTRHP